MPINIDAPCHTDTRHELAMLAQNNDKQEFLNADDSTNGLSSDWDRKLSNELPRSCSERHIASNSHQQRRVRGHLRPADSVS